MLTRVLYGRERPLSLANGERRTAQYAIVDLSEIIASHDENTFSSSTGYPVNKFNQNINDRNYKDDPAAQKNVIQVAQNMEPERLIELGSKPSGTPIIDKNGFVVSGNNRTMSLKLAVKEFPENYQRYLEYLTSDIDIFGFDKSVGTQLLMKESIPLHGSSYNDTKSVKFDHPVLVRIDKDIPALNTTELAKYNLDTKKSERPVDKLIKLSNILRENDNCRRVVLSIIDGYETFSDFYSPGIQQQNDRKRILQAFTECGLIPEARIPEFYTDGMFTETGKDFIENILASIILEPDTLKVAGSEGVKRYKQIIVSSLPVLIANENLTSGSLKDFINEAVIIQYRIQQFPGGFSDFLVNQALFDDKLPNIKSVYLNRLLDSGRNKFKEQILKYNEAIKNNSGESLFGGSSNLTPNQIFDKTIVLELPERDVRLIERKYGTLINNDNLNTQLVDVTISSEVISPTEIISNIELFFDDNYFKNNPDKILGKPYTDSGRFGPVTKYRGDITVIEQIDVSDFFIGNEKALNDPLLSVDNTGNISANLLKPEVEQFIKEINETSEKEVGKLLAKKRKKALPVVEDNDIVLTKEVPELQSFEQIYSLYNPEISAEELEVFVWYKSSIGKPLSKRWARLINKEISDDNLSLPYNYQVPQKKLVQWVNDKYVYYYNGKLIPAPLYISGDIYDKKFDLESEREEIVSKYSQSVYDNQETTLLEVFREKYNKRLVITGSENENGLVLLPISKFAEEFYIERLETMSDTENFRIKKITAESSRRSGMPDFFKDQFTLDKKRAVFEKLNLKDAFSYWILKTKPELKENVTHQEVVKYYLQGVPMRTNLPESASPDQKSAEKTQFAKLKASLQKEGERLFGAFLDKELSLNDKVKLETSWNAKYNNYVPVNFHKIPVAFTMTKYYKGKPEDLRPEKREAVAFVLSSGSGCLAYDVGVGKTPSSIFTISAFMDAGYCSRPFVCVPNQVYKQFISEIKGFVPHIPILEAYNLGEAYIENFKGANGEIQAVPEGTITVMTYEGLEQLGFSDVTYDSMFTQLYEILNQGGESEREQTARQKESFLQRLGTLLGKGLRGSMYNIEDFKFDFGCYDEAHRLKKVFTAVKGEAETDDDGKSRRKKSPYVINSGVPSAIGLKAFMLNQYILKENGFQNILLLTATPFTNSPLEIFSMLAMLAYEQLQSTDLNNIKNFFDTYVRTSTDLVINAKLKPEFRQVILGFNNLISLQSLIRRYILYKTGEDVNVQRPKKYVLPYLKKIVEGTVIDLDKKEKVETFIQMSPLQKALNDDIILYVEGTKSLSDLVSTEESTDDNGDEDNEESIKSEVEEVNENYLSDKEKMGVRMLRGINMARNTALSPYLNKFSGMKNPDYKEYVESSPKIYYVMECIKSVKLYHQSKGEAVSGQVIYCDRGLEYFHLLKEYLIKEVGFKTNEVGIIRSGMPSGNKPGSKEYVKNLFNGEIYNENTKLFESVSDEERIKIVIGSSTIKEGINLQRYATVLYDLWEDWNPTDLQQLEGRIWRQGNLYNAVRIAHPLLLDSMDIFIFQKQQEKTSRLNTIWSTDGHRNVLKLEEFDPAELKYALIRDPFSVARLRVIDEQALIDSEITGIQRLGDRIERIKKDVDSINEYFDAIIEKVSEYRNYESTNDKLKDATKVSQLLMDVVRKQTDKDGLKLISTSQREKLSPATRLQHSYLEPLYKPYYFDEFNDAQRNLQRELNDFIKPTGIFFSLSNTAELDKYKEELELQIKTLEERRGTLESPENIARLAKEVISEREAKKITYKPLEEVIRDFAKLNYLLSERKIVVPQKLTFSTCPPMQNGERLISDEAIAFLDQCIERETDTKAKNVDDAGNYFPGRLQIQERIIDDQFRNVRCISREKPIAVFTGGAPGSGKSSFLRKHAAYLLSPELFHVDADEIRAALPEYKGWNATVTHRETQDIVNKLLDQVGEGKCRYDLIYDGTMNKANKYFRLINHMKRLGYETYIIFMDVPYSVSKKRVLERYRKTGRFVPMPVLDEFFEKLPNGKTKGQDALDQLKMVVDGYVVVDGVTGKIIDKGGKSLPNDRQYGDFLLPEEEHVVPGNDQLNEIPLNKRDTAEQLIKSLEISKKYLKGEVKVKAEKQISSLKLSLKYL